MSIRIIARSSSNRNSASARASSVLPTPVGPRNRNEPMRSEERRVGKEGRCRWAPDRSSRRRHTRWTGDWSSDVCSSDLLLVPDVAGRRADQPRHGVALLVLAHVDPDHRPLVVEQELGERPRELGLADARGPEEQERADEIGRASCRERGEMSVGAGSFKQKTAYEMDG